MPLHGIGNSRSRRYPLPIRAKFHIGRLQDLHPPVAAAKRAAGPTRLPLRAANAERHQRAAIVQIDANPVPTNGLTIQVLARPFVIEPSLAGDLVRAALTRNGACDSHMRQAVVVTRSLRRGALAADAGVAVEQNGLSLQERQIQ